MADIFLEIDPLDPPFWKYEDGGPSLSGGLNSYYADEFAVSVYDWTYVASWATSNGYTDLPIFPDSSAGGINLPVTMVSYLDVLKWCNAKSEQEGKKPVYWLEQDVEVLRVGSNLPIEWNILDDYTYSRDGYRLPHDTEWIYAANDGTGNASFLNPYPGISTENDFDDFRTQYFENSDYGYQFIQDLASKIFVGGSFTLKNPTFKGPRDVADFMPSSLGFYGLCSNVSEYVYRSKQGNCLPHKYVRAFGGNFLNTRKELILNNSTSPFLSRACILSPSWTNYSVCGYPNTFRVNEKRMYVGFRTFRTDITIPYTPFSQVYPDEPINLRTTVLPTEPTRIPDEYSFEVGVLGSIDPKKIEGRKLAKISSSFDNLYFALVEIKDYDPYTPNPSSGHLSSLDLLFANSYGAQLNGPLSSGVGYITEGIYINSIAAAFSSLVFVSGKDNNLSGFQPSVNVSGFDNGYLALVDSANYLAVTGAIEAASSNETAFLLLNDGRVTGWGWNEYGHVNPETGLFVTYEYYWSGSGSGWESGTCDSSGSGTLISGSGSYVDPSGSGTCVLTPVYYNDLFNDSSGIWTGDWGSTLLGSLTGVKKIGCAALQTVFLFEDGSVSGIGYSGDNNQLANLSGLSRVQDIFVKESIFFALYENGSEGDLELTGIDLVGFSTTGITDFANGLKNVIDLDFSDGHIAVVFDDFTVTGTYVGPSGSYCGEADFYKIDYPVYAAYAINGATLLKRDPGSFTPVTGGFSFKFKNNATSVSGLDIPISRMTIEASIPKRFIQEEGGRLGWFYSPQSYALTFPSGSYFDQTKVYMSVSGASLTGQTYTNSGGQYEYLRNPAIEIYSLDASGEIGAPFEGNEFWQELSTGDLFELSSSNFIDTGSFAILDPALLFQHSFSDQNAYQINLIEKNSTQYQNWPAFYMRDRFPSRYKFNFEINPVERSVSKKIINDVDEAFIEYNVSGSGTYSKNVIGYQIDFLESTYSPPELIAEDISNLIYIPVLDEAPQALNGFSDYVEKISSFCIEGLECPPEEPAGEPGQTCWSGRDITGLDYQRFFAAFIQGLNSGLGADENDATESDKFLKVSTHDVFFQQWTGFILFNDFIKGDLVDFAPYAFSGGYNQYYRSLYFTNPPYADLEKFTLKFKSDFYDPTGLVETLNSRFSGYSYQKVWYPYDCPTGFGKEGVFIDVGDALAYAEIVAPEEYYGTGVPGSFTYTGSGELESKQASWERYLSNHSGRVIKITSNHFHESGHNLSLRLGNIRSSVKTKVQRGNAYLLPSYFELHASMDGSDWDVVDIVSGFQWSGIEARPGAEPGVDKEEIEDVFDLDEWLEEEIEIADQYPGRREDIIKFTRSKVVKKLPWCGGNTLEQQDGTLFWFADVPVNYPINLCKIEDGGGEKEEEGEGEGPGGEGEDRAASYYKAMGSLVDPDRIGVPDHYYLRYTNYNFYKIKFRNFANEATGAYINPVDEFKVKKITFYGTEDVAPPELTGPEECVIGSDYSIDISGYVPVLLTGYFSGSINELDSGFVNAFNVWVEGEPSGLSSGDLVRFNKESGRLVSDYATGPIRTGFYLTGEFETGKAGWYYNPATKEVTLFKEFSTTIDEASSGSGSFVGSYIQLKEEVVNRELAGGGFLQPGFVFTGVTGTYFYDSLIGFKNETNLTGCFEKEFLITGESQSGFFSYSDTVTGSASGQTLIYGEPTGFITATGVINYVSPSIGDFIVLNEEKVSYNPDSVNFSQPYYFDSFETLANTLTGEEYSFLFDSSFSVDDICKKIYVYSDLPGESGNSVSFYYYSTGGIFTEPSGFLSGGQDLNQYITALDSATYSGEINLPTVAITGFYTVSSSGSGYIYGYVDKLLGVRNFTDVWSLYTGLDPKFDNMYLVSGNTGDISVSGNYTGELLGLYPEMLNLNLFYDDVFSTAEATLDVARLGIFDSNYSGSGVYHIITSE